jgi:serine/threonine protein kinase
MLFQRYRILGELGVGGMGSVYLAEQTGPGGFRREVVLKMLRINGAVSEDQRLMLLDEAQLTGLISHPNVIVLHEAGEHQGLLFLALERVRGVSLSELLRRLPSRKLPIAIAAGLVAQACAGLHAAHEWQHEGRPLDLVHRDVSMSNLMCDINGRVRVIDFGIARANVIRRAATDSHLVRGNPAYMAPEQFLGGPLDRRVDIYSTALVFYELCAGEHPFKQKAQRSVVPPPQQPLSGDPPSPRRFDRGLPRPGAVRPAAAYRQPRSRAQDGRPGAGRGGAGSARTVFPRARPLSRARRPPSREPRRLSASPPPRPSSPTAKARSARKRRSDAAAAGSPVAADQTRRSRSSGMAHRGRSAPVHPPHAATEAGSADRSVGHPSGASVRPAGGWRATPQLRRELIGSVLTQQPLRGRIPFADPPPLSSAHGGVWNPQLRRRAPSQSRASRVRCVRRAQWPSSPRLASRV